MESEIKIMNELIKKINQADYEYYVLDNPTLSDKEYDTFYNQLLELEKKTGIILPNSQTQKVSGECVDFLKKVKHNTPMLSANKTKNIYELLSFTKERDTVASFKLDGLTLVLKYENGKLSQALTRGNGYDAEDVTHNAKNISNIPLKLHRNIDLEIRGECLISWEEFNRINKSLETPYSHPRNLAAGTLRQLDSNVSKQRRLSFLAFELIAQNEYFKTNSYKDTLVYLKELGFDIVPYCLSNIDTIDYLVKTIDMFNADEYLYPVDGIVFKYDNLKYGESLGATGHHYNDLIAYKWTDELYETTLRDIEWNTTRTGLINPVAVFDEVEIEGAKINRATLHNVSYIENLKLGIGDKIRIYKANKIIPKVHDNLTKSDTYKLPKKCPSCGKTIEVRNNYNEATNKITTTLFCKNEMCPSRLTDIITHYVSKYGMNIVGLSKKTLETLLDEGYIKSILDIYSLKNKSFQLKNLEGFGDKSVTQLLNSIEKSKETDLEHFIYSLGIKGIGRAQSKIISNYFKTIDNFNKNKGSFDYTQLDTFGEVLDRNIHCWFNYGKNLKLYLDLLTILKFKNEENTQSEKLKGKSFVITGSLSKFKNRDEAKKEIESLGGKVIGSVSKNTSYLVNNDIDSTSSKNKKAKELDIPIISEDQLLEILRGN